MAPEEVVELLEALLDRTLSSEDWDYFVSVELDDPELEKIRMRTVEMWYVKSPYRISGSIDPSDLNVYGIAEVRKLIDSIKNRKS